MDFELCDAVVLVEVDWLKHYGWWWVDLWFMGFDLGWFLMGFRVRIWYGFWFRNGFRDGFSFWIQILWVLCGFCFDFFVGFMHGGGGNESPQSTFSPPSRISSFKNSQTPMHKPLIVASTFSGSLHLLFANAIEASLESECSIPAKELHVGAVSCVDVKDSGAECVIVEGLRSAVVYL